MYIIDKVGLQKCDRENVFFQGIQCSDKKAVWVEALNRYQEWFLSCLLEDGRIIRARPGQEKREFYPLTSTRKKKSSVKPTLGISMKWTIFSLLVVELTCGLLSESVIQSQSAHH